MVGWRGGRLPEVQTPTLTRFTRVAELPLPCRLLPSLPPPTAPRSAARPPQSRRAPACLLPLRRTRAAPASRAARRRGWESVNAPVSRRRRATPLAPWTNGGGGLIKAASLEAARREGGVDEGRRDGGRQGGGEARRRRLLVLQGLISALPSWIPHFPAGFRATFWGFCLPSASSWGICQVILSGVPWGVAFGIVPLGSFSNPRACFLELPSGLALRPTFLFLPTLIWNGTEEMAPLVLIILRFLYLSVSLYWFRVQASEAVMISSISSYLFLSLPFQSRHFLLFTNPFLLPEELGICPLPFHFWVQTV